MKPAKKQIQNPGLQEQSDTPIEKVGNWFKDLFNVCGKTSCCNSNKNPYHDNKTWEDLNEKISYVKPKKMEEQKRHTEQAKL